jgi:predicted nucleic acid-binding protein
MSGRYLLDTNIIIALFANDIEVNNQLVNAEEIFIPSVAIGELFYGARKSERSPVKMTQMYLSRKTRKLCGQPVSKTFHLLNML